MHTRPNDKKHRKILMAGTVGLLAVIIILLAILISSCNGGGKFDKLYKEGAEAYTAGKYTEAAEKLEKALEHGESVDCYVLLANTYYSGLGDMDKAIEVLYIGSYKLDSTTIDSYLESLKALKAENGGGEADVVTIGTETISKDVTSLVLSQQRLKNSDIIPLTELKKLESLSLTDNAITDITPLSGLTELTFLQLGNNQVSSLAPLSGLTKLRTLYLDGNPISDFSALKSLGSLTTLSIKSCGITDEQLEELEEALPRCSIHCERSESDEIVEITLGGVTFKSDVTELDLSGKSLTDISELEKCTSLQKLDLRDNKISDLTPLMDLGELSWLCIWNNDVEDILPLMGLSKLAYLDADLNEIKDITAVSALTAMEELWLSYNEIGSFKPLGKLPALQRLGLKGTGIADKDLETLMSVKTLKELSLEENTQLSGEAVAALKAKLTSCTVSHSELTYTVVLGGTAFKSDSETIAASGVSITSIQGLNNFAALKTLQLTNTGVGDLSPLKDLKKLEVLEIWNSDSTVRGALSDISALAGVSTLKNVNLMWNTISDISALSASTGITELHLSGNNVSNISALSGMGGLTKLTLDYCPVSSISALSSLSNLSSLSLQYCGVGDLSPLRDLTGLSELYLKGNNISDVSALKGLTNLKYLHLSENVLTADQVRELQKALPGCDIYTDLDLTVPEPSVEPAERGGVTFGDKAKGL